MQHDLNGFIDQKILLNEAQIKCIMHQLLDGLEYLHSNSIMHRDIKGANVLINNEGEVKLADFGLARLPDKQTNPRYTNRVATLWYRAPELLLGTQSYTSAVDMWSLGCVFFELLTFRPLFPAKKENDVIDLIYKICGTPNEEIWPGVSSLPYFGKLGSKTPQPKRLRENLKHYPKYSHNNKIGLMLWVSICWIVCFVLTQQNVSPPDKLWIMNTFEQNQLNAHPPNCPRSRSIHMSIRS